jgi:hypothetical protein
LTFRPTISSGCSTTEYSEKYDTSSLVLMDGSRSAHRMGFGVNAFGVRQVWNRSYEHSNVFTAEISTLLDKIQPTW